MHLVFFFCFFFFKVLFLNQSVCKMADEATFDIEHEFNLGETSGEEISFGTFLLPLVLSPPPVWGAGSRGHVYLAPDCDGGVESRFGSNDCAVDTRN